MTHNWADTGHSWVAVEWRAVDPAAYSSSTVPVDRSGKKQPTRSSLSFAYAWTCNSYTICEILHSLDLFCVTRKFWNLKKKLKILVENNFHYFSDITFYDLKIEFAELKNEPEIPFHVFLFHDQRYHWRHYEFINNGW